MPKNKRLDEEDVYELFSDLLESMTASAIVEPRSRLNTDADRMARPFRWIPRPNSCNVKHRKYI